MKSKSASRLLVLVMLVPILFQAASSRHTSSKGKTNQVEYTFYQGLDSNLGDIKNIPGQTVNQLKIQCNKNPDCLGFNTNGWIKSSLLPQSKWNKWSDNPNEGFYVKASPQPQYTFYQGADSDGGDIKNIPGQTVDQLKAYCSSNPSCLGFNTNGWVKSSIKPQSQWVRWSNSANQGFYLKNAPAPQYTFYQGVDSNLGDIKNIPGQTVDQLKAYCNSDATCLGFNTNGWVKNSLLPQSQWNRWSNNANEGFYVKDRPAKYTFYQGVDSNLGDIKNIPGQTVDQLKAYCNSEPTCLGFNTNGWVKNSILPQSQWNRWSNNANEGLYLKQNQPALLEKRKLRHQKTLSA